jgi:hypothetical protein
MTSLLGDGGKQIYGSLKTINIILATPREVVNYVSWPVSTAISLNTVVFPSPLNGYVYKCTTAGTTGSTQPTWPTTAGNTVTDGTVVWTCQAYTTGTALPTANDNSTGASFTLQQSDFPTITGIPSTNVTYTAHVIVAGVTPSGSVTVSSQPFKNGTSQASATTQSNNNNTYTHTCYSFSGVNVGDTLNVYNWANATGCILAYYALIIYPTQFIATRGNTVLSNLNFSNWQSPSLTKGTNPYVYGSAQSGGIYVNTTNYLSLSGTNITIPAISQMSTGIYRCNYGDTSGNGTFAINSATTGSVRQPYYPKNQIPCTITFREVLR